MQPPSWLAKMGEQDQTAVEEESVRAKKQALTNGNGHRR